MKTFYADHYGSKLQNHIYAGLNSFASQNGNEDIGAARLCGLPVAILDVTIETLKRLASVIESVVFVIINFFGSFCSDNCSMQDAFYSLEFTAAYAAWAAMTVLLSPLKIFYQTIAIIHDPEYVQSISHLPDWAKWEPVVYPLTNQEIFEKLQ